MERGQRYEPFNKLTTNEYRLLASARVNVTHIATEPRSVTHA